MPYKAGHQGGRLLHHPQLLHQDILLPLDGPELSTNLEKEYDVKVMNNIKKKKENVLEELKVKEDAKEDILVAKGSEEDKRKKHKTII